MDAVEDGLRVEEQGEALRAGEELARRDQVPRPGTPQAELEVPRRRRLDREDAARREGAPERGPERRRVEVADEDDGEAPEVRGEAAVEVVDERVHAPAEARGVGAAADLGEGDRRDVDREDLEAALREGERAAAAAAGDVERAAAPREVLRDRRHERGRRLGSARRELLRVLRVPLPPVLVRHAPIVGGGPPPADDAGMVTRLRRLVLVRHGETDWNRESRFQGTLDAPLNDDGRRQAEALAERLRGSGAAALYASPLSRAAETARIVGAALGREPVAIPDLREIDVGVWGGLTYAEVRARWGEDLERIAAGEDVAYGGGETAAAVQARVAAAMDALAEPHPGETVVVVSHGLALKAYACRLLGLHLRYAERISAGGNTAVSEFEFPRGTPRLVTYADTSHLARLRASPAPEDVRSAR